jgi:DNA-binding SARP family transcriptional activator
LFALAKLMNQAVPTPMTITTPTRIDIHVLGVMRVQVNGRSIPLKPTGRAAEVLALLLRHGHRMALDQMLERIYPDKTSNREKQRKALWTIVQQLRQSLGWQDSIVALGGAYELSEQAQWHVHPNSFVNIAPQERYLDGIHSEWVLEVNQEIQNQTPRQLN